MTPQPALTNFFREYLKELSDAEKFVLIEGYEELETTGMLGTHPLRSHAKSVMLRLNTQGNIVLFMRELAMECYREFARRWLKENQV